MGVCGLLLYKTFCEGGFCGKSGNVVKVFCAGCNISSEFGCTSKQSTRRRRNVIAKLHVTQVLYVALFLWTTCTSISGMIFFSKITFMKKYFLLWLLFTCGDHMRTVNGISGLGFLLKMLRLLK